jgi:hypothetical protein
MKSEQRKKIRKPLRHGAWLHFETGTSASATISDVSDTGARLDVDEPDSIPDRFVLLLSKNGKARRLCRVVWRNEHQLGVQFERPTESPAHAT